LLLTDKQLHDLRAVHSVAVSKGNADANQYMFGMANGIELMLSIVENREVDYLKKFGDAK
jgi:hypothetical protein